MINNSRLSPDKFKILDSFIDIFINPTKDPLLDLLCNRSPYKALSELA